MVQHESKHILWRAEFSVGVVSIDTQHQGLLSLLNRLNAFDHGEVSADPKATALIELLEDLNDYAADHFLNEEALMRQHLPPDAITIDHIVAHRSYWTIILTLKNRLLRGDVRVNGELVDYLNRWWINHIQATDQELGRQLNRRGVY